MKHPSKFMDISESNLQNQDDTKKEKSIWYMTTLQVMEMQGREALPLNMAQHHQENQECLKQGSEVTVECLSSVAGDLSGASTAGQLPQDEKHMRK